MFSYDGINFKNRKTRQQKTAAVLDYKEMVSDLDDSVDLVNCLVWPFQNLLNQTILFC